MLKAKNQQGKANSHLVLSKDCAGKTFSLFFSFKPITLAVAQSLFLMSLASVSLAAGGYNLSLPLPSTTSEGSVIFKNFNDTVDGTHGQTLYYLTGSDNKSLEVTFDKTYPIYQAWDAPYDKSVLYCRGYKDVARRSRSGSSSEIELLQCSCG